MTGVYFVLQVAAIITLLAYILHFIPTRYDR